MRLVVNAGNGAAGHVIDAIEHRFIQYNLPIEFIKINHQADGNFPNGIPNPLLAENRADTIKAVRQHQADIGIAWDGDFDRCFFFDDTGEFVQGYYVVGILADIFLQRQKNNKIIHDPRLQWNTIDIVESYKAKAVLAKTGHAFIKAKMREENAVYGGEISGHHYFRDFNYCDSGMIPWLLVIELLSISGKKLSSIVNSRSSLYPCSEEINLKLARADRTIKKIITMYQNEVLSIDDTDGISLEFSNWRFNLRKSNTEELVRLNIEAKNNKDILTKKTQELLAILTKDCY